MDSLYFLSILIILASAAVLLGVIIFIVWAAQYFCRRAYRRATRLHLYQPAEARVKHVLFHRKCATLYVVYKYQGKEFSNRFLTTHIIARWARQLNRIALLIDPDYPKDVVVAPEVEWHAANGT